jgi:UDP-3-O-[3-hydroxymyristoyl] glucosamine N-acyltransferase
MSLVTASLPEPGEYASGTPLQGKREWRRNAVRFGQLDRIVRALKTQEPTPHD